MDTNRELHRTEKEMVKLQKYFPKTEAHNISIKVCGTGIQSWNFLNQVTEATHLSNLHHLSAVCMTYLTLLIL